MLKSKHLETISKIRLPERYAIDSASNGLSIINVKEPEANIDVTLEPFRSRRGTCRRVLAHLKDERNFIIEFARFNEDYNKRINGIIRARKPIIEGNLLRLDNPRYREDTIAPIDAVQIFERVHQSWTDGIRYNIELLNDSDQVIRSGLRKPQIGALHAIFSHWTLSSDTACIVLPTGTGKTEVMIATAIGAVSKRVLVIVPTDALRQQTVNRSKTYGILNKIGIINDLPFPIVGALYSKPTYEHFDALRNCNIVISTMSSIGLADETVQKDFAALFSHIFFDEAHHIEAATWKRFHKQTGSAKILLLTATPFREDGKPLKGKIIYNFPLGTAQEHGYFKRIRFLEVFEPDERFSDEKIAHTAVTRLREDQAAGYDHILMARARCCTQIDLMGRSSKDAWSGDTN